MFTDASLAARIVLIVLFFWVLLLCVSACTPATHIQLEQREPLGLSTPGPVVLQDVEVRVITTDNAQAQLLDAQAAGNPPVLFGLTEDDYKALQKNLEKLRGKLDEYSQILLQYKSYYEGK
jgi:hypothetical protein